MQSAPEDTKPLLSDAQLTFPSSSSLPTPPADAMADALDATPTTLDLLADLEQKAFQMHSPPSTSPRRIPRPANAFMLFRSDFLKKNDHVSSIERKQQTLSKLAGRVWREMPDEEKREWRTRAEGVKSAHRLKFPGYKFTPMRGSSRSKMKAGLDCDDPSYMDRLHSLVTPQSPVRRKRSSRKRTPTLKLEHDSAHTPLNLFPPTSLQTPGSNGSYFFMLPRRPSSAPGFRPTESTNTFSPNMDMVISPDAPRFTHYPPRRPSTALGFRTDGYVSDFKQPGIQQPINNSFLANQPAPTFSNPFFSLARNMDAMTLRSDGDHPYVAQPQISPLDHGTNQTNQMTYTTFAGHPYPTNAVSPTNSEMSVDTPTRPMDIYVNDVNNVFPASAFGALDSTTCAPNQSYTSPYPFNFYPNEGTPLHDQDRMGYYVPNYHQ